jgi:hypothetical protein
MALIDDEQASRRQADFAAPHGATVECLDRCDLNACTGPGRDAGLNDAVINPDIV